MARVRLPSRSRVRGAWIMAAVLALPATGCSPADQAANAPPSASPEPAAQVAGPSDRPSAPAATPASAATFEVSDLTIEADPGTIRPGDVVMVTAWVQNTGSVAGTFDAVLTVNGSLAGRRAVDLEARQSVLVRMPVQIQGGGRYDLRMGDQQIALLVAAPAVPPATSPPAVPAAFTLATLEVTPNPAETGDRVTVRVTVANTGGETGTHAVELRIDGKVVRSELASVPGSGQQTVEFSVPAPGAGRHTVSVGELETRLVVWKIARQPNGKVLVNKVRGGYGKLTVRNRGALDAVLVFTKPSAPRKALLAVYVRAGKSATVTGIKDGTYVVFYTAGARWDAHGSAFTTSLERRRFDDNIRFRTTRTSTQIRYTTWTLTLQARSGGNAPTTWIGEDDFPGVP